MNETKGRVARMGDVLFGNGCGFLFPGLVVYLVFWRLRLPIGYLKAIFVAWNALLLAVFVPWFRSLLKTLSMRELVFWNCLFLVFLVPGAYLEFPSDTWEHARRIFRWGNVAFVGEHEYPQKFASFWFHSIIGWVPIAFRRIALDLLSALTQLLLSAQFYRLLRKLRMSQALALLQVAALWCFFGTNLFSYRYYALSTSIVAYIAYLATLSVIVDAFETDRRRLRELLVLIPLVVMNHAQEALFVAVGGSVVALWKLLGAWASRLRGVRAISAVAGAFCASWVIGVAIKRFAPGAYGVFGPEHLTRFGTLRIWSGSIPFLETWGVHGLLAMAASAIWFRRFLLFSLLTLAPLAISQFPPAILAAGHFLPAAYDSYRLIYLFPTSVMLVFGIRHLIEITARRLGRAPNAVPVWAVSIAILAGLSLNPRYPWRGRALFQLYRPGHERSLVDYDAAATWVERERGWKTPCVMADNAMLFTLTTQLGWEGAPDRVTRNPFFRPIDIGALEYRVRHGYCGVMILDPQARVNPPHWPGSWVGRLSHHWSEDLGSPLALGEPEYEKWLLGLKQADWKRTPVPPFYLLLERNPD